MGGTLRGAGSGIIIGLAAVVFGQELGFLDLGPAAAWILLVLGALAGAIVFGILGHRLGRPIKPVGVQAWTPPAEEPKGSSPGNASR